LKYFPMGNVVFEMHGVESNRVECPKSARS
jgi:hypothetical protein